jgi:hypothetical protein
MNKIPVLKTIGFAYAFTFAGIGTIIGLVWLPTLLIGVLQFLSFALGAQLSDEGPAAGSAAAFLNFAFFFATILLYAMNAVAVTRLALGKRPEGIASVHFSLGRPEWRVLGGYLFCAVLLGGLLMVYLLGMSFATSLVRPAMSMPLALGLILYVLVGICLLLYVGLRLMPLLVPVTVAEDKLDLARGWQLMAGNTLRMLGVLLGVSVPVLAIQTAATLAIGGSALVAPLPSSPNAIVLAINARMAALNSHMPELIGLFLILAPFSLGLTMSAEAAAYRALVAPRPAV